VGATHYIKKLLQGCLCLAVLAGLTALNAAAQQVDQKPQTQTEAEIDSRQQLVGSLLSLNKTLELRHKQAQDLNKAYKAATKPTEKAALQIEISVLNAEILQTEEEIDLVVLGLQARQFSKEGTESAPVDIKKEVARVFEPIVLSLERATEPARRMEELRQLSEKADQRIQTAQATLDHIAIFREADVEYSPDLKERLDKYEELWQNRLSEAQSVSTALAEQLQAAKNAQGNSFKQFSQDFGSFIINRGASLLLALGLGVGFIFLCQLIRMSAAAFYRKNHNGVLSASMRVFSMALTLIGIIGSFFIAIMIFNIRNDWLMLALSLLLGLAISWTFVRSLPAIMEQTRVLLNLGAVREGERTIVNGLPYKIERLSLYSKLVNPALKGGALIYPVRELIGMHSRPVTAGEAWFPTQIGDWIVRTGSFYEVMNQTPEHVTICKPSGAQDFVPVQEFLGAEFEVISNGYAAIYVFGLAYKHLDEAREVIPDIVNAAIKARVKKELGFDALKAVDTRFVSLGDSALQFKVFATMAPGFGHTYGVIQKHINRAVVDACLANDWEIPFPQMVVHKGES